MTNELIIATNVVSHDITGLDVVNSVNRLYSSVFGQLLTMLGIVATFVVVILPILFQIHQRRENRIQEAKLVADITAKANEQVKKILQEAKELIDKRFANAKGFSFHLQANAGMSKLDYVDALQSSIWAAHEYLACRDHANLMQIMITVFNSLGKLTAKEMEEEGFEKKLSELEEKLNEANETGFLSITINKLAKEKKAALKR
jgi:hypothetical protein